MFLPPYEQALASLLTQMLQKTGHLAAGEAPKDIPDLLAAASFAVEAPLPMARVVIEMDGGTVVNTRSDFPVDIVMLDADTEGGDESEIHQIGAAGGEFYVSWLGCGTPTPDDVDFVRAAFGETDAIGLREGFEAESPSRQRGLHEQAPTQRTALQKQVSRASWDRAPGNPYASESTYDVMAVFTSNRQVWDLVERHQLRDAAGKVDAERFQQVFAPLLQRYRLTNVDREQIAWDEIAAEFDTEVEVVRDTAVETAGQQRADQTGSGPSASTPDVSASQETAWPSPRTRALVDPEPASPEPAIKGRPIDPRALEVLRHCTADEVGSQTHVHLPPGQLERRLYESINEVLVTLGGKWNRSKGAHVFEGDARDALHLAVTTGTYLKPQDFGYFPTPLEVARQVIEAADIQPGMLVLEPSAGTGALADLAAEIVGRANVHCVELLPSNRQALVGKGYTVRQLDFLEMAPIPLFDRVVMNPPFENLADTKHVMHAAKFLKPDGKLVSVASPSFQWRQTRQAGQFREFLDSAGELVHEVAAGAFKASGTNVATVILKVEAARMPREFWGPLDPRQAEGERPGSADVDAEGSEEAAAERNDRPRCAG